jgi:hypothetical protein|tara:strand:- start:2710 stop:3309 length:600 start_codon:yes stop_codon:yes gene_type:complete
MSDINIVSDMKTDNDKIEYYISKLGYDKQLYLAGYNEEDRNQLIDSILTSYNGDEIDINSVARYSFYDNLFYRRLLILAWVSYIFLFIYYAIKINKNLDKIENKLLFFFGLFTISQLLFTIIYCLIYYIWFSAYNNNSISNDTTVSKWKNIKSNNEKVMLYVRRNILSSVFISSVLFDPFLSRWINMLSTKEVNNQYNN